MAETSPSEILNKIRNSDLSDERKRAAIRRAVELGLLPAPREVAAQQSQGGETAPTTSPMRVAQLLLEAPARGTLDVANLPSDLLNLYLTTAGGLVNRAGQAVLGRDILPPPTQVPRVEQGINAVLGGSPFTQPQTTAERFVQRAGREASAAALTSGLRIPGLSASDEIIKAHGLGPTLVREAELGAGAGLAGQMTQELGGGPVSEIAAQVGTGAILGNIQGIVGILRKIPGLTTDDVVAGIRAIRHAPRNELDRFLAGGATPEEAVTQFVSNQLRREGNDVVAQRLEQAIARQAAEPSYQPTLGQATEAPGLLRLEAGGKPQIEDTRARAAQRTEASQEALTGKLQGRAEIPAPDAPYDVAEAATPRLQQELGEIRTGAEQQRAGLAQQQSEELARRATQTDEALSTTVRQTEEDVARLEAQSKRVVQEAATAHDTRVNRVNAALDRRLARAEKQVEEVFEKQLKSADPDVAYKTGQQVREAVDTAFKEFNTQAAKDFAPLRKPNIAGPVPDLFPELDEIRLNAEAAQAPQKFPERLVRNFAASLGENPARAPATFEQLLDFRSKVLEYQREVGPNPYTRDIVDAIHKAMRDVAEHANRPDLIAHFDRVRADYRVNIQKFVTGVGEQILRRSVRGYEGEFVPASQVIQKILSNPAQKETIDQFAQLVGGQRQATAAFEEYLAHSLYLSLDPSQGGKLTAQKLKAWREENAAMLSALERAGLTGISDRFTSLEAAQRRLSEVEAAGKRVQQTLKDPSATRTGRAVQEAEGEARELLTEARMTERAGREAEQALRREGREEASQISQGYGAELRAVDQAQRASERDALRRYFGDAGEESTLPEKISQSFRATDPVRFEANVKQTFKAVEGDAVGERGVRRAILDTLWQRANGKGDDFAALVRRNRKALGAAGIDTQTQSFLEEYAKMVGSLQKRAAPSEAPAAAKEISELFQTERMALKLSNAGRIVGGGVGAVAFAGGGQYLAGPIAAGAGAMAGARIGSNAIGGFGRWLGAKLGANYDAKVAKLLEASVFDPDLSKTLTAVRKAGELTPEIRARLHAHLIQLGIGTRDDEEEE